MSGPVFAAVVIIILGMLLNIVLSISAAFPAGLTGSPLT